jgi:CHASE2 domain-containing sensor protein
MIIMSAKNLLYSLICLCFAIVIGAAVYEHLGVVPQWSAAPPASLSMFQGKYGLAAQNFWMPIHPVCLVLFLLNSVLFWKTDRRKPLLIAFGGYFLVLVITATFFVPELLDITGTPFSETIDAALTQRAKLWETLSIIRMIFLIGLAFVLFSGLTQSGKKRTDTN